MVAGDVQMRDLTTARMESDEGHSQGDANHRQEAITTDVTDQNEKQRRADGADDRLDFSHDGGGKRLSTSNAIGDLAADHDDDQHEDVRNGEHHTVLSETKRSKPIDRSRFFTFCKLNLRIVAKYVGNEVRRT